jgi:hypothetical protein
VAGCADRTALFQVFEEPFGASFFDGFLFFERFCFCEEFLFPDDFPIIGFSGKAFMIGVMSTDSFIKLKRSESYVKFIDIRGEKNISVVRHGLKMRKPPSTS